MDMEVFRVGSQSGMLFKLFGCLSLSLAGASWLLLLGEGGRGTMLLVCVSSTVFGAVGLFALRKTRRMHDRIEIDDRAIHRVSPQGIRQSIAWRDVRKVMDGGGGRAIKLVDGSGRKLQADYRFEEFDYLRTLIQGRLQVANPNLFAERVFQIKRSNRILFAIRCGLLFLPATVCLIVGAYLVGFVLLCAGAAYVLYDGYSTIIQVAVQPDGIELKYPFQCVTLPFITISDVRTEWNHATEYSILQVRLELKNGQSVSFGDLQTDTTMVGNILEDAWMEKRVIP
jgi:hypothetical protein